MARKADKEQYLVNSVLGATRILNHLAEFPRRTLSDIASALDITRTLCFRMLTTLEEAGLVQRNEARQYSLGYACLYLGFRAQHTLLINEVAAPVLEDLTHKTGESAHLVVRDGLGRVIVALRESAQPVRVATPVGAKFPLHYGGTGLCILAYLQAAEQQTILSQQLPKKTTATVIEPKQIRKVLDRIREDGYHVAKGDFAEGAFSVAAPVFAADGLIFGSICVAGPQTRLKAELEPFLIEQVCSAGQLISLRLGYRPRSTEAAV